MLTLKRMGYIKYFWTATELKELRMVKTEKNWATKYVWTGTELKEVLGVDPEHQGPTRVIAMQDGKMAEA